MAVIKLRVDHEQMGEVMSQSTGMLHLPATIRGKFVQIMLMLEEVRIRGEVTRLEASLVMTPVALGTLPGNILQGHHERSIAILSSLSRRILRSSPRTIGETRICKRGTKDWLTT